MPPLEDLAQQARALAEGGAGPGPGPGPEAEVARVMQICNACRYCEGYCAVFQAMTRRLSFAATDAHYLANLCHQCGACLHACQYAPPHEFAVNVPRAMAEVRLRTYAGHAWPAALGRLYRHAGLTTAVALGAALSLFVAGLMAANGSLWHARLAGHFYALIPHRLMVALFAPVLAWVLLALGIGGVRFWRQQAAGPASATAVTEAIGNVLRLRYLDGGHGDGCNDEDDRFTLWRQRAHHATFYGFMLCFAATVVATLYHYGLGLHAPYPLRSAPVLLGTAGGLGLLVGPAGLAWLNLRRDPLQGDPRQRTMDLGLITLLIATSGSGLALLVARDSAAMGLLLALHLGSVMALFVTMPYGKFAHGVYRALALLAWSVERRQPSKLQLGGG